MASSTLQPAVPNPNPNPQTKPSAQNLQSKKRALEYAQNSPYSKMRVVLKDARPLVLEVLRAPDVQGSTASHEIQKRMQLMVDLCKQMAMDTPAITKCKNGPGSLDGPTVEKAGEEKKEFLFENMSVEASKTPGTYVVGKSAFGWNFITFGGTKPVYYGRTKELFRAGK